MAPPFRNPAPLQAQAAMAQAKLDEAMALHQAGRLDQAQALYRYVVKHAPAQPDAHHLLGVLLHGKGDYPRAIERLDKAVKLAPANPVYRHSRAGALQDAGRLEAALASFDKAVALAPDYAQAWSDRGSLLLRLGRGEEAVSSYDQALAAEPAYPEAWFNRGVALQGLARLQDAVDSYGRALGLRPGWPRAWTNRGAALKDLGQPAAALDSYDRALALEPAAAETWANRGAVLGELGRTDEALAGIDRALALDPGLAQAHYNRGIVLAAAKQPAAALDSFDKALALDPALAAAWSNRGLALRDLRRLEDALGSFDNALALHADFADAWHNRGAVLQDLKRLDEAVASYDRVLALKPDDGEAHMIRATALLLAGDYARGWPEYEWRWTRGRLGALKRDFGGPPWLGERPLAGKTLLLHAEQGLGDVIMFCRYARLAARQGARVILEAPRPLLSLLAGLEGAAQLVEAGTPLPPFDLHCPLLSLPLAFGTTLDTVPAAPAYLAADPARTAAWAERLGPGDAPRIGLVWSGDREHRNDRNRSIPLAQVLARLPDGFDYVSLQPEVRDGDRAALGADPRLRHFGAELRDFADTAALAALMDRVVSVDTSAAHLAAALGRPTDVLIPFIATDWRWLVEQTDSPWYPSMILWRQGPDRGWENTLDRLGRALAC